MLAEYLLYVYLILIINNKNYLSYLFFVYFGSSCKVVCLNTTGQRYWVVLFNAFFTTVVQSSMLRTKLVLSYFRHYFDFCIVVPQALDASVQFIASSLVLTFAVYPYITLCSSPPFFIFYFILQIVRFWLVRSRQVCIQQILQLSSVPSTLYHSFEYYCLCY